MNEGVSPQAKLLRAFSVEFLTAHNADVARRIMADEYCLSICSVELGPRDSGYLPATVAQLDQFPGLCVTAHDVVIGRDAVALRFTEHGVSAREQRTSSWGGITLFRIADGQLVRGWAEEDYFARKLQLRSGEVNLISAPHPAPWDQPVSEPDVVTERVVRDWLADPQNLVGAMDEISAGGPPIRTLVTPVAVELSMLFTAGGRAAFHAVITGTYAGGFEDVSADRIGQPVTFPVAAIVDVIGDAVARVQLCGDRLGLHRSLTSAGAR